MSFCGLIKGISPKVCILCVRVKINKRSLEPFCVWILCTLFVEVQKIPSWSNTKVLQKVIQIGEREWIHLSSVPLHWFSCYVLVIVPFFTLLDQLLSIKQRYTKYKINSNRLKQLANLCNMFRARTFLSFLLFIFLFFTLASWGRVSQFGLAVRR